MVQLIIEFQSEGLSFDWDAGVFARKDAAEVAAMIERQTEEAALGGEDVTYIGFRTQEVLTC